MTDQEQLKIEQSGMKHMTVELEEKIKQHLAQIDKNWDRRESGSWQDAVMDAERRALNWVLKEAGCETVPYPWIIKAGRKVAR